MLSNTFCLALFSGFASKIDGEDAREMVGSNTEKNVLYGSYGGWTLEALSSGLGSLATSLHVVGTHWGHI